jgi:hypothetical protein
MMRIRGAMDSSDKNNSFTGTLESSNPWTLEFSMNLIGGKTGVLKTRS